MFVNYISKIRGELLAALLVFLLPSCSEVEPTPRITDPNTEPTQVSVDLTTLESKDGTRTYRMKTPLMEYYELADEPFTEFKKGIHVETYNDSTGVIESDLVADYVHYNQRKELWVARGNVIANNYSGDRTLYTEELWWDEKAKEIYSNVDVRVREGKSAHVGKGFRADEGFNTWMFTRPRGQMEVTRDSTATASPADSVALSQGANAGAEAAGAVGGAVSIDTDNTTPGAEASAISPSQSPTAGSWETAEPDDKPVFIVTDTLS